MCTPTSTWPLGSCLALSASSTSVQPAQEGGGVVRVRFCVLVKPHGHERACLTWEQATWLSKAKRKTLLCVLGQQQMLGPSAGV